YFDQDAGRPDPGIVRARELRAGQPIASTRGRPARCRGLDDSAGPPAFVQDGSGEKPPRGAGLDAPEVRWVSRRRRGGGPSLASIGSTVTADGPCPASGSQRAASWRGA